MSDRIVVMFYQFIFTCTKHNSDFFKKFYRGYMAPEYLAHGQLTEKADVYSFGVLVLEIVTGKQNNRSKTLEYADGLVTVVSFKTLPFQK